jgi:YHS domain-containing protein
MGIDLVCGMIVDEKSAPAKTSYQGADYHFCAVFCKEAFRKSVFLDGPSEDTPECVKFVFQIKIIIT